MKTESKSTKTLQILTIVGAVLYFIGMILSFLFDDLSFSTLTDYLTFVLLFVFMTGFALSRTKMKMATGIIFMIWNAGVWIATLYLIERQDDYSMMSAIASSFMVIGALFILEWYKNSSVTMPSVQQQWKFVLRLLLINYAVLYFIVVFSEVSVGVSRDYFSYPFIIYPLLLLIFLVGFLLSWIRELLAGFIFLVWCVILIFASVAYPEMETDGWPLFGVPILLQGIFYIKNHYKFRPK